MTLQFHVDDLTGPHTRELIAHHLADMRGTSPQESVHALDPSGLGDPAITVWSAWDGSRLVGVGALKELDAHRGELKSMRVADAFRGTGAGRAILRYILAEAASRGLRSLWLETGSEPAFLPARTLYASEGFVECAPFGDYSLDPYSVFMTKDLSTTPGG